MTTTPSTAPTSPDLASIHDALSEVMRLVESAPGLDPSALDRLTAAVEATKARVASIESTLVQAIGGSTATILARLNEVLPRAPSPRAPIPAPSAPEFRLTEEEAERVIQGFGGPKQRPRPASEAGPEPTTEMLQAQLERLRAARAQQLAQAAPPPPVLSHLPDAE